MDFTEHIITYYSTESKHGFAGGLVSGIVLIVTAISLWRFSNPQSILKGLAVILFLGGLIFSFGGYYAGSTAKKALSEKTQLYKTDKQKFIEREVEKVESVHKSWTGIKIFWSAFILLGLVLIFTATKSFWSGIALGALIIGTIGHIEETISMQHNEKYRNEVLKEKRVNNF
jgi:uncharacterized protein with PQ loop repeat